MRSIGAGGDVFRLTHHPQQIATQHFLDVFFAIASIQHPLRQVGIVADVLQLTWCVGNPVKVATQPHMVDPRNVHNVIDVVKDDADVPLARWDERRPTSADPRGSPRGLRRDPP